MTPFKAIVIVFYTKFAKCFDLNARCKMQDNSMLHTFYNYQKVVTFFFVGSGAEALKDGIIRCSSV